MPNERRGKEATMKAAVYGRSGSPGLLELEEVELPLHGDDEVLARIRAAAVNPYDWRLLRGYPYFARIAARGMRKGRGYVIVGADMAGVIEAVGPAVGRFRPGDEIYAETGEGCFALTALQGLRGNGRIADGQRVLVNGAGGGIGTFAVQLAKALADVEVTGVCSESKQELVRSIGADHVLDYARVDFTRSGERYDLLLDTVGNHSARALRRALTRKGCAVLVGGGGGRLLGPLKQIIGGVLLSPFVSQRIAICAYKPKGDDLEFLGGLIETGKVIPVIDRTYPLSEVAGAIRHLEQGHARGKTVIEI
jgi:NADPH:quinone reductase-like Zn-dependent oxidoreductase